MLNVLFIYDGLRKIIIEKKKTYSIFFRSSHLFSHFSLSSFTISSFRRCRGKEHSLRCSALTWRIYGLPIVICKKIQKSLTVAQRSLHNGPKTGFPPGFRNQISWFDMWFNIVKPRFLFKTVDLWSYIIA